MTINLFKRSQNRIIAVSNKGVVDRAETTYDEFLDNKDVQQRIEELYN